MQKKEKFGIRKIGIGVCSILISLTFLGGQSLAEEVTSTSETQVMEEIEEVVQINETELAVTELASEQTSIENENLIQNGSFDEAENATGNWSNLAALAWENPWIPTTTNKANGSVGVDGGRLYIHATGTFRTAVAQAVAIDANKKYVLEYDVETANVVGNGVRARVRGLDDAGKEVSKDFFYTDYVKGTSSTHIQQILNIPQGASNVKVELFFENSTGEAWIDNVSLKEYIKPEEPKIEDSIPEPETGTIQIAANKAYLPIREDLRYEIINPAIARLENQIIYPLAAGTTEVAVYEGEEKRSTFILEVSPVTDTVFRQLRENWEGISLSNQSYNPADNHMKTFLGTLEVGVADSLTKWVEPSASELSLFNDIDFNSSSHLTTAYRRLEQMAQVFENSHSTYYHDRQLLNKIKKGMAWLYDRVYNEQKEIKGNWWDYEIGAPRAIVNILIYLHPYFGQEEINKYTAPISKFVPNVSMIRSTTPDATPAVGGNQTDLSKVAILEGALREDGQRVRDGVQGLTTIMKFVDKGEGFYEDGSFIDHTNVAYTGAYGNVLMDGFSQLLPVIQSTEFALDSKTISILYDWIERSFVPILVKGELMDMTRGRSISRANGEAHVQAVEILRSLARLAEASSEEKKMELQSIVKGHLQADNFYSAFNNLKSYRDIELLNQILSNANIPAPEQKDRISAFNNMDKFVYKNAQSDYTLGISMYSSRTQNYEDMNNENRRGWYTSDGMVYLYNGDLGHYSQHYWPTVNPYRLPGTTVVNEEREDGSGEVTLKSAFVGATQLDNRYATVAMDFNNWNDSLFAQKSWFVLGDKIVFLGTDVHHSSDKGAVTTIENRKLAQGQDYTYYINGQAVDLSTELTTDKTESFYMTNGDSQQSIGYVFLNGLNTHAQVEERTGKWSDINYNQPSTEVQNRFVTLWHDHPKESSQYAYVMIPNKSMEEVQRLGKTISVLKQEKDLQVVYDAEEKVWGVVKYQDGDYQLNDDVTLTKAGLYTIKKTDGEYVVSYYNPETKSTDQPVSSTSSKVMVSSVESGTAVTPSSTSSIWRIRVQNEAKPSQTSSTTETTVTSETTSRTETTSSSATSMTEETIKERATTTSIISSEATTQLSGGKTPLSSHQRTGSQQTLSKKLPQTGEKSGRIISVVGMLGLITSLMFKKRRLE